MSNCLARFSTPQLSKLHSGKVRESYRIDRETRMIVVTDRISAFDRVLPQPIEHKGAVLNRLANFWFEKTRQIADNHLICELDPNVTLVCEAIPIRIKMIVRGYLTGSMWRGYQRGKRVFSGFEVADGLTENQRFEKPLVTPTTKEAVDREMTPKQLVDGGWVEARTYRAMEDIALNLFRFGSQLLAEKGILLADTKYEFGLVGDRLILIDEIHTPDSSRFWSRDTWETNRVAVQSLDKEFVRAWVRANAPKGDENVLLPEAVVAETSRRYLDLYRRVTGEILATGEGEICTRIHRNLVNEGLIKDGFVVIVMGSTIDLDHAKQIAAVIESYDVMADLRVVSAHKNPEEIPRFADEYNDSVEPGAAIAVAGLSNGLGGALAANLNLPVFSCPPFSDKTDMMVNVSSSLQMPSSTPAATVIQPRNAALAALRALNLRRLRRRFTGDIDELKSNLRLADREIRGR